MKDWLMLLAGAALAVPALGGDSPAVGEFTVTGSVTPMCHLGTPTAATLALGMVANTTDGSLASLAQQSATIPNSWCNASSTIAVAATPLVAQTYTNAPPSGFTRAVNFTTTVSGWSGTPVSFSTTADTAGGGSTGAPSNRAASLPVAGTITLTISNFATPSAGDRLVADTTYSGAITITLTAAGS